MIVLDLRETHTIGPLLAAVERVGRWFEDTWNSPWLRRYAHACESINCRAPLRVHGGALWAATLESLLSGGWPPSRRTVGGTLIVFGVGLFVVRNRRSLAKLLETRLVRALRAAVEPPGPPDKQ